MARTLSLPLQVSATGRMVTVEQDSPAGLRQRVALLLDTRPGERRSVPEFGMDDPLFTGVDPQVLAASVARWEPGADAVTVMAVLTGTSQTVTVELGADEGEAFA